MEAHSPNSNKSSGAAPATRRPWLKFVLPLVIVGAGFAVNALLVATRPEARPVEIPEKAWPVDVAPVSPGTFEPGVPLFGRVESLWSSQLTAGIAADVVSVPVIEGDEVAAGALLVELDDRDARLLLAQREAELAEAEARIAAERTKHQANLDALPRERQLLELTEAELGRAQDLRQKGAGSQSTLDTARQAVERQAISLSAREQAVAAHEATLAELEARRSKAEALRDQAQLELERTRISAPFAGRIARVRVAPGKRVRVGDALLDIYDTGALVIRALLPARYLPVIRSAHERGEVLSAQGDVEGFPVRARLLRLAGEVQNGGVEGLFAVDEGAERLPQGRFVRFDLALPAVSGLLALPYEAIYGGDRVYRVDDQNRLRPGFVERVGEVRDGERTRVLVRSASLARGDRVILTQLPNAVDGLLVQIAASPGGG